MSKFYRVFLLLSLCSLGFVGCGGGSEANQTANKSELDAYLAEHPESANAAMPELNE